MIPNSDPEPASEVSLTDRPLHLVVTGPGRCLVLAGDDNCYQCDCIEACLAITSCPARCLN